jgi:hypothetical protein
VDRRTTIKWVMAVGAAWPLLGPRIGAAGPAEAWQGFSPGQGYGTDPNLLKVYKPGELWPLTSFEGAPPELLKKLNLT